MYKLRQPQKPTTNAPRHDGLPTDSFVFRESDPTDMFYIEEDSCAITGEKCVVITNPLSALLNQNRLDKLANLGADNLDKWLNQIKSNVSQQSQMSELMQQFTNDEIRSMIRSRHIQSPSELENYMKWASENLDAFHERVQSEAAKLQADEVVTKSVESEGAAT